MARRRRKRRRIPTAVAVSTVVVVAALGGYLVGRWSRTPVPTVGTGTVRSPSAGVETAPSPPLAGRRAQIAIVVDDLGRSLDEVAALRRLGVPLTFAVLPFESRTPEVVAALARGGGEVLCHLPMEASNGKDPGPGALLGSMSRAELRAATARALAAVPVARGVNNHMGSSLSTDPEAMGEVMRILAARGLYFLDSRTSAESVAYRVAVASGVPAAERNVFLDVEATTTAIGGQFARLLELSREQGFAVAIGHPYPETVATLALEIPRAEAAGYEFVTLSAVVGES